MKLADPSRTGPLFPGPDQSWAVFRSPASNLRLNTLDFSDLWDEEDLGLYSAEEDREMTEPDDFRTAEATRFPLLAPPLPPCAPPLPPCAPPLLPVSPTKGQTLRLHWRGLESLPLLPKVSRFGTQTIWAGLEPVLLDTNKLEYLFEKKTNNAFSAKEEERKPCVSVLEMKRSNIIAIALSRLPPPHLLPPAIFSMDRCVLDRDDLQKLQALVPSDEELCRIREAQFRCAHSPLAPAEDCLLLLGSIPYLSQRLHLWAFALDYDSLEREIAEPLFHLKLAMEQLAANQTFRCILAAVLAIGNFLNGCKARGFELSYLGKLAQVKDTHSRQTLLHHVCVLLLQSYPQSSDLYSDITDVTRASKCDYSQVQSNLSQLEFHCKASWEQLRVLERDRERDSGTGRPGETLRQHLPSFLKECEERLSTLRAVHRRVINRFHSFLLFLGYSRAAVKETRAEAFCKTVSDFALEYRTVRHAILQQQERKKEDGQSAPAPQPTLTPSQEALEHCKLEEVLRTPESSLRLGFILPRQRSKKSITTGRPFTKLKW